MKSKTPKTRWEKIDWIDEKIISPFVDLAAKAIISIVYAAFFWLDWIDLDN